MAEKVFPAFKAVLAVHIKAVFPTGKHNAEIVFFSQLIQACIEQPGHIVVCYAMKEIQRTEALSGRVLCMAVHRQQYIDGYFAVYFVRAQILNLKQCHGI